ncbi:MAG: DUF1653 domain-containing protein [Rickettsiaceae bacterium]|nr:DUF1653 domain-containing protein [Rickettsiaceae bacterium]
MNKIKQGKYRHYKGNHYQVIGVGTHTETLEQVVLYQSLYGDYGLWVRPLEMFQQEIEHEGKVQQRFEFISE